ncbi:SRPBCC family protein [Methyloraptor flagellatus]|uniref:SRPBCC family protein n=1 Tax=Methyloraptor flagellatus TaxID=3162530 RepID=A0AAU7X7S7_9HYPH
MTRTDDSRDLVLERVLDTTPDKAFRCWTDPSLVPHWFCPPPWKAVRAVFDVRSGGTSEVEMHGPEGQVFVNRGLFLEVVPNRKLVFTDAYVDAWTPSERPFMTGILTFDDLGDGRTRYVARVRHWSEDARREHEQMGFHQGWGIATDQMVALARTL